MGRVERFEDLIAWQKARRMTREVYRITMQVEFAKDYGLARQIQRASVSIMSNVAEGFERGGRAEFHQFLSTAKASCAETRSLLYVALDAEYLDEKTFERLLENADEVARIIGGLRAKVEQQRDEQRSSRRNA
ncbi:MAG: four helix bundle protein [Thermomicrobiales bacterium]